MAPSKTALFTGYYEPVIDARRSRSAAFSVPIHRKPKELTRQGADYGVLAGGGLKPFASRSEIAQGALKGRGLEIAYLADPVDAFFLHIQGSGRLRLGSGEMVRVGFAAKNGHALSLDRQRDGAPRLGDAEHRVGELHQRVLRERPGPRAGRFSITTLPMFSFARSRTFPPKRGPSPPSACLLRPCGASRWIRPSRPSARAGLGARRRP